MRPCQRLKRILDEYCDGALKGRDKNEIELHLSGCSGCGDYVHGMQNLKAALKTLPAVQADENFIILLRERIRREAAKSYRAKRLREIPAWRWAFMAGVAVIAVFTGFRLFQKDTPSIRQNPAVLGIASEPAAADPVPQKQIQYVLEDLSEQPRSSATASPEALQQAQTASSDSANRERRLDQIRDQVKIVNF